MAEYSPIARTIINMWNSSFTKTFFIRTDRKNVKFNYVKTFNSIKPTNRNSNKKMKIKEYKKPTGNTIITSKDGLKIVASVWLNPKVSDKWVVGVHGFNSSRFDVLYLTWHYRALGYNILTFDFRNHGASENDIVSWGYKEKWDLMSVIEWLTKNYIISQIGLVGTSMGAFTCIYTLMTEQVFIEENKIRWLVSDSAYMSVNNMISEMISDNAFKMIETYAQNILEDILKIYKQEYKVDFKGLDFIKLIQKGQNYIPIMFIHNRFDRVTNFLDSFKMQEIKNNIEHSDQNELIIYDEGYNHTKSIIKFTKDYTNRTLEFVKKHQLESK
ncbi:hydrolase [Entomoplasma ellychniae]|uniref:Hydrolase n=1 Tax=Entomoplasma ellychniae TaxID=2114 RepID=A0A8E2QVL3_9MOLU|nr:alpha/beta fold hydrolase [Entomoplasma ellychniae]PPE04496.1 hydrolase [Entomoplasma ellychniae]